MSIYYILVETMRKLAHIGDRVSTSGGCEVAVTARTRYWCVRFIECAKLLY